MSKNEFDALLLKKLQEEAFEYNPDSWQQLSQRLPHAEIPADTNGFDNLLIAKLQEDSFEPQPGSWENIRQKLEDKAPPVLFKRKRRIIAVGIAAALCIIIALTINFQSENNNSEFRSAGSTKIAQPDNATPAGPHTPVLKQPDVLPEQNSTGAPVFAHHNKIKSPAVKNKQGTINPDLHKGNDPTETLNIVPNEPSVAVDINNKKNNAAASGNAMTEAVSRNEATNTYAQSRINQMWPDPAAKNVAMVEPGAKTNMAFGGGVNYGNLNTGYTAAVTLKRKIGGDFFVDGTVAMIYNNNANNVAVNNNVNTTPPAGTASKPTASSFSSPALEPIQRLYYVQINPSVGYQLEDRIALSVGGDFQQILNKSDQIVQPDNNKTKVFPTMDVGLTTKSEFTISPNLQAGLVYREGLSNLIGGDAGKYVNRRYLQVQFKYNIPLK